MDSTSPDSSLCTEMGGADDEAGSEEDPAGSWKTFKSERVRFLNVVKTVFLFEAELLIILLRTRCEAGRWELDLSKRARVMIDVS